MVGRVGGLIAAVVILIGSVLPWATVSSLFGSASVNGTDGDGVITLILAIGIGVLLGLWRRGTAIAATVLGAIVVVVALYDLADVANVADELGGLGDVSPGVGLVLVLLGGLAATAASVVGIVTIRKAPASAGPAPYGLPPAQPYGQPFAQPPAQPLTQPFTQPVAQPVAQPFTQPVAQPAAVPAGWLPDPTGAAPLRYWDGTRWTEHVHGGNA